MSRRPNSVPPTSDEIEQPIPTVYITTPAELAYVLSPSAFELYTNENILTHPYYRLNKHKSQNYYDILNVQSTASIGEINTAYKQESLRWHPDRHIRKPDEIKAKCGKRFIALNSAYEQLKDEKTRRKYDDEAATNFDAHRSEQMTYDDAFCIFTEFVISSLKAEQLRQPSAVKFLSSIAVYGIFASNHGFMIGATLTLLLNGAGVSDTLNDLSEEEKNDFFSAVKTLLSTR
jgi:curved DNA-binding protein CbpA